jgi:hypothetical protein
VGMVAGVAGVVGVVVAVKRGWEMQHERTTIVVQ